MGWKASFILIDTLETKPFEDILTKIGFTGLEKTQDLSLDSVIYPKDKYVYIGFYKGNLIISAQYLPFYFLDRGSNIVERKVVELFPGTEICALSLSSTINHWGFAIIKDGKKIRLKGGVADSGTVMDIGEPVKEELPLLSRSRLNDKGKREYILQDGGDVFQEDQVGEEFIFELFKRYTGDRLDHDEDTYEARFFGYSYQSLSGPDYLDIPYCGGWSGYYIYGSGYKDTVKGKTVDFEIRMDVEHGVMKGISKEEGKEPAEISGFIFDQFVGFTHRYPVHYFINAKGESIVDASKPGSKVFYSGLYDYKTSSFRGIWRIEGRNNWGEWFMKKR
jgi:hypothetical protein